MDVSKNQWRSTGGNRICYALYATPLPIILSKSYTKLHTKMSTDCSTRTKQKKWKCSKQYYLELNIFLFLFDPYSNPNAFNFKSVIILTAERTTLSSSLLRVSLVNCCSLSSRNVKVRRSLATLQRALKILIGELH